MRKESISISFSQNPADTSITFEREYVIQEIQLQLFQYSTAPTPVAAPSLEIKKNSVTAVAGAAAIVESIFGIDKQADPDWRRKADVRSVA